MKRVFTVCPKCNESLHLSGAKFCAKDGTELVEYKRHTCGSIVLPFHKFCPGCGAELGRVVEGEVQLGSTPNVIITSTTHKLRRDSFDDLVCTECGRTLKWGDRTPCPGKGEANVP